MRILTYRFTIEYNSAILRAMDKYNGKKNKDSPDYDETGEIMSWVIIFILMIAFWPIGLLLLLKKLNLFTKPAKKKAGRNYEETDGSGQQTDPRYMKAVNQASTDRQQTGQQYKNTMNENNANRQKTGSQYKKVVREAENTAREVTREAETVAREVASDIAQAARGLGQAARQAISEIQADLTRDFTDAPDSKSQQRHPPRAKPGSWKAATSQSQSWQSFGSRPWQSAPSQPQQPSPAESQPQTMRPPTGQAAVQHPAPPSSRKTKAQIKKGRTALEKKSGKFISIVLLLISLALFILGANTIAVAARDIWGKGIDRWPDFFLGIFYFIGGFIALFSRNISARRFARYKRFFVFVSGRGSVPIPEIARASGLSVRIVKRDIQAMINEGYLDRDAYIDRELNCLVMPGGRAEEADGAAKDAAGASPSANADKPENRYMEIILELREINNSIADVSISEKIDRIEEFTGKIFRIVEENPEKLPRIRRFMNYYLPTTIKLLRSYATLEKQGIDGENITTAKESIGRVLDTLATGYKQQLDQLFESDAIDIAADINVLENLMQQDGLTENKTELKTMEGV